VETRILKVMGRRSAVRRLDAFKYAGLRHWERFAQLHTCREFLEARELILDRIQRNSLIARFRRRAMVLYWRANPTMRRKIGDTLENAGIASMASRQSAERSIMRPSHALFRVQEKAP